MDIQFKSQKSEADLKNLVTETLVRQPFPVETLTALPDKPQPDKTKIIETVIAGAVVSILVAALGKDGAINQLAKAFAKWHTGRIIGFSRGCQKNPETHFKINAQ